MSQTTIEMPLLGRCKECDFALFVASGSDAVEVEGFRGVKAGNQVYHVGNEGFFGRCPNRHKVFVLRRIKGTYSPDHKCDARCLNAKGHSCTCSCGGANHGRGHAATVVTADRTITEAAQELKAKNEPPTEPMVNFIKILLDEREIPSAPGIPEEGEPFEVTGEQRKAKALRKLDAGEITKDQAHKIINWLKTLPMKDRS